MPPIEGQPAPEFTLPSSDGLNVSISDFRGKKNVVLYFYPKDDTPGCTIEACNFRDALPRLELSDTVVFGVSVDGPDSHRKFIVKYKLPFALLTDEDGAVAEAYAAWDSQKRRCRRVTAVIGKSGLLLKHFPLVDPEVHAGEVLKALG